jgi:hypothetical protein
MFHPPRIRRGAAAAIHTRRHGAAFGAAAAAFFFIFFKKAVCLLNRNRNILTMWRAGARAGAAVRIVCVLAARWNPAPRASLSV